MVTALAVAGVLAAIPAGAALAGGSDSSDRRRRDSTGAVPAQNTPGQRPRRGNGDRDRGDCPEKDGRQSQGSAQI